MIWVEVLGRHGHVVQRVRCPTLPATLGRAWTCDVVLDDRHVDPVHARLVLDGEGAVVLEDLGSLNGVTGPDGARIARLAIEGPVTVHLGQTALRLVPAGSPVGPAVPLPPPARGVRSLVTVPRRAVAVAVAGVLVSGLAMWATDPDADALRSALAGAVGLAAAVAAWAGVWALVGRSAVQHARFLAHFGAVWLVLLGIEAAGVAGSWLGYVLNADAVATALDAAAAAAGAGALLVTHFALATSMLPRRRVIVAAVVVAAAAGTALLLDRAADGGRHGVEVSISAAVLPAPPGLVRAQDFDAFLADAAGLRRAVDRLAAEGKR